MLTFLDTSDAHIGYRQFQILQRELDCYNTFQQVADIALQEEVDVVLLKGDLFQTPRPRTPAIACALKFKRRLQKAGIQLVGISGNHDAADPDWLDILGIHNLDRKPFELESGCLIGGHSYMSREALAEFLGLSGLNEDIAYLVIHQTFDKIAPHPSAQEFTMEDLPPHKVVLSGHVHQYFLLADKDKDTVVHYSGNTEYWRIGEDSGKAVSIWTEDGQRAVPLKTRPVIDFTLDGGNEASLTERIAEAEDLPIVLLRYMTHMSKQAKEIQKTLQGKALVLKAIPQRDAQGTQYTRQGMSKAMKAPSAVVDDFLTGNTPQNKLAHMLVSSEDDVDSVIAGFREQYLEEGD